MRAGLVDIFLIRVDFADADVDLDKSRRKIERFPVGFQGLIGFALGEVDIADTGVGFGRTGITFTKRT